MKPIFPLIRAIIQCLVCLLASPLQADDTTPPTPPTPPDIPTSDPTPTDEPARDATVDQATLDEAIAEVQDRVEMAAPMEITLEAGIDPVVEACELGVIVDVSLDQVEAALAAAALTPEIEDDLAALELKHRGSYRFFCDGAPSPPDPPAEPSVPSPPAN